MANGTDFAPALGQLTTFSDFSPGELSTLAAPLAVLSPNVDLYTTVTVSNTTSATDLFGGLVTVPANYLGVRGAIRIACGGDYFNNTGSSRTIRLKLILGATTLWDSGVSDDIPTNTSNYTWTSMSTIQTLGAVNKQRGTGLFVMGSDGTPTTGGGKIENFSTTTQKMAAFVTVAGAEDTSLPLPLVLSVTHSAASASLYMRMFHAHIEFITSNR